MRSASSLPGANGGRWIDGHGLIPVRVSPITGWLASTIMWFGVFITVVFVVEAALLYFVDRRETDQRLDKALIQWAPQVGGVVAKGDNVALRGSLDELLEAHALSGAAVYGENARLLADARSSFGGEPQAGWLRAMLPRSVSVATQSAPIVLNGHRLGRLELSLDSTSFASVVGLLLMSAVFSFFVLAWLVTRIVNRVRFALRAPSEAIEQLSKQVTISGNYEYRVPALGSHETFGFEQKVNDFLEALSGREQEHVALNRTLYAELAQRAVEIARQAKDLQSLAYTSAETKLPNRLALAERVRALCAAEPLAPGHSIGLFLCHVTKVKHANEAFGFDVGAMLVQFAARRFEETSPPFSELFHLGGADFAVVIDTDATHMAHVAEQLIYADDEPFVHGGASLRLKTRIGYALFPEDAASSDELIRFAPLAIGEAINSKALSAAVRFKSDFLLSAMSKESLEDAIRDALDQHQIEPFFQPRVDALSGRVSGFEAFVRWKSPALKGHDTQNLIAIAERSMLISDIDSLMLRKVAAWMGSLAREGIRVPIALNVSAYTLERVDYVEHLMSTLREFDVDHRLIELELTETVLIDGNALVNTNLKKLQQLGINILLDDFGAGYSSLRYLHDLPISVVKIDKAFVQGLPGDEASRMIIESTLDLCQRLGKRTVAEGVETAEQLKYLRGVGCDEVQGYYLMRPMSATQTREALVREYDPLMGYMSVTELASH